MICDVSLTSDLCDISHIYDLWCQSYMAVMSVGEGTHPRGRDLPVLGVCHRLLWHRLRCVLWVDDRSKYDSERDGQRVQRRGRVRRGARSGLIASYWPKTWLLTYSYITWLFYVVISMLKIEFHFKVKETWYFIIVPCYAMQKCLNNFSIIVILNKF